jgi:hypothetical protein
LPQENDDNQDTLLDICIGPTTIIHLGSAAVERRMLGLI